VDDLNPCVTEALGNQCESSSLNQAQPPAHLGADAWVRGAKCPWLHSSLLWNYPAVAEASAHLLRGCFITDNSMQRASSLSNHETKIISDWFLLVLQKGYRKFRFGHHRYKQKVTLFTAASLSWLLQAPRAAFSFSHICSSPI